MQATVLIVDDNAELAGFLERLLAAEGFDASSSNDAAQARKDMARLYPDAVLMDIKLPDANGVELLSEMKKLYPETQFIMMTAFASVKTAIKSIKIGAYDYLSKPFDSGEMIYLLNNALQEKAMREELALLRSERAAPSSKSGVLEYPSSVMKTTMAMCEKIAPGKGNVLLTGESGVGKNYLAGVIHTLSSRVKGPFFDINCASLAPSLIESELFGHEPGAFTGARGRRRGLIELAHNGTLFLDEIGDMPVELQAKLLSFLDTHKLRRLGGEKVVEVDVRIIAATNRDLKKLIGEGRFREDLFYRLNVVSIEIPPLRARKEDIPLLVEEICRRIAYDMGLSRTPRPSRSVLNKLKAHSWPGNVRELRNALERAIMLAPDKTEIADLRLEEGPGGHATGPAGGDAIYEVRLPPEGVDLKAVNRDVSRALIEEALRRAETKKEAADLLGVTKDSLAHSIKTLKIKA